MIARLKSNLTTTEKLIIVIYYQDSNIYSLINQNVTSSGVLRLLLYSKDLNNVVNRISVDLSE